MRTLASILLAIGACAATAQVMDRIVASVDRQVITQSDWETQERFEALAAGSPAANITLRPETLERLIDRTLVIEQLANTNYERATEEDVAMQVKHLRQQLGLTSDEAWKQRLATYGLEENDIQQQASAQMDILRFINLRFRPAVRVSQPQVEEYYRNTLLPELRRKGTAEESLPPFAQEEDRITNILTEKRVNDIFNVWLESLRGQAKIRRVLNAGEKP